MARAMSTNVRLWAWSGCVTTIGAPASPPAMMSRTSGNRPSSGSPNSSAIRAPPSRLKMWDSRPHARQTWKLMFSTTPRTGASTSSNILMPRRTSSSATSCGVVTITPPDSGTFCTTVNCASPVPGGRSTTSTSNSPHSTLVTNSVNSLSIIGPRQITAWPSGTRNPIDMTRRSYLVTGIRRLSSVLLGLSVIPSINGMLGPYTSASSTPTRCPVRASAAARLTDTVDLPTPPLPLATATTWCTPGMAGLAAGVGLGAAGRSMTISTGRSTSGLRVSATLRRIVSTTSALPVEGASSTVTAAPPTAMSLTTPKATMSRLKPGYLICLSASRNCCGVGVVDMSGPYSAPRSAWGGAFRSGSSSPRLRRYSKV